MVIHTGSETVLEQAAMFQGAALVIGAHGAGLSNLVFCESGASLILFPMQPHVVHTCVASFPPAYFFGRFCFVNEETK